jgi:O-methyltransferase
MVVAALKRFAVTKLRRKIESMPPEFSENLVYRSLLLHDFKAVFASHRIAEREAVWDHVADTIGRDAKILFLEFGVHEGYSIRYFMQAFRNPDSRFFGFDSFEGLPEVWGRKKVGTFSTDGRMPDIDDARVTWVKGWFQETMPDFRLPDGFGAVLVHLDADLYSSTLFVLSQLWHRCPVYYAVFDEFAGHETRALHNFTQAFPSSVEFLAHDDTTTPRRVFCRITRK